MPGAGLTDFVTAVQNGVAAANNLSQLLIQATVNSSSLRVQITGASTTVGTVTQINSGTGLTGGPIIASGTLAVSLSALTNSLSSDVALTNISSFFDGPSVAQGSSGVFMASGSVTVFDSTTAVIQGKLWDGTTVMASTEIVVLATQTVGVISLSGLITNPSSNIKISVRDITATTGKILANTTTLGKDSTIAVVRVG